MAGSEATVGSGIRYEDDDLAVVNKPAGLVVHRSPGEGRESLVDELRRRMPLAEGTDPNRPGIVHRLDLQTSGLLVVAKTERALEALLDAMKARRISRTYLCLAAGSFGLPHGRIEASVGRSPRDPTRMSAGAGGKPAATNFKVLEKFSSASLLEVTLETGRTHQIRVHLSHIRHPVVGDPVYGPGTGRLASSLGLARPFLHAARLRFVHPFSGDPIDVSEPLPTDLEAALALARRT